MSDMYSKIKHWYDNGFWSIKKVRDAAARGWITEEEFEEITGVDY